MKYNVCVIGGGLSGVAAAVAAARGGAKTLLVERSGALGGAMSNSFVYPFMRFWGVDENNNERLLSKGIFSEMRERHAAKLGVSIDSFPMRDFKPEYYKFILDDMCVEAGVDLLFHTVLTGVSTEGERVSGVTLSSKSGDMTVEADYFIDASGDGDLFAFAGCEFELGRPEDGFCQPMTTCFRMSGVDKEKYLEEKENLQALYKEHRASGNIRNPRENILVFWGIGDGILHFNTTRVVKCDPTDPFAISRAEVEARAQIHEIVTFLQKNSEAFRDSVLISVATDIGVRESRRLIGRHVLTAEELLNCADFPDTIALGNYDIDIHNPAGTGTNIHYFKLNEFYRIPYRSLLPKEYNNLLVAGRCISATHEAQAAVRVMPICACLGEAAGTAAALALKDGIGAPDVDFTTLRNTLTENGAAIL